MTPTVLVLLLALSESLTWTLTTGVAGPSGKVQSKLPEPVAASNVAPLRTLPVSQLSATTANVSVPGSLTVNV